MSSEIASLKAEFEKLLAEVRTLRNEAAQNAGSSPTAAVGHPDVRTFPDHPGANPAQLRMDLKEMETMLLAHDAKLNPEGGSK